MNKHLLAALIWMFVMFLTFFGATSFFVPGPQSQWFGDGLGVLSIFGFAAIFLSWAIPDAKTHGKSRNEAVLFAVLWLFLNILAHFAYLLFTRGVKQGVFSCAKFFCFLLLAVILAISFAKLLGAFLR